MANYSQTFPVTDKNSGTTFDIAGGSIVSCYDVAGGSNLEYLFNGATLKQTTVTDSAATVASGAQMLIFITNTDGGVLYINPSWITDVLTYATGNINSKVYFAPPQTSQVVIYQVQETRSAIRTAIALITDAAVGVYAQLDADNTFTGANTFTEASAYAVETSITAHAGGGQGSAVLLTGEFNNITISATSGDSVKLPPAVVGLRATVKNNGAANAAVFPATGDTIDGGSVNSAVVLPVGGSLTFNAINSTDWESSISPENTIVITTGITAHAGGGQGSAVALTTEYNNVTTVTTAGDSVKLPTAYAGLEVIVDNSGANSLDIFPITGGTINGGSANAQIALAAGARMTFVGISATDWKVAVAVQLGTNIVGAKEVDHNVSVTASSTAATPGGAVNITAGAGSTSGAGGAATVTAGAGGATGAGGAVTITSGAATNATSGTGAASGVITIHTPASATATTGTGGAGAAISVTGSAGGVATGAAGIGGAGSATSITSGAGGAASDAASGNAGAGGAAVSTAGAGGAATGTGAAAGGAGGSNSVIAGAGGAAAGTATPGAGGAITITAGAGGSKSGTGHAGGGAGGSVSVGAGAGGNTASNGTDNAGAAGTYTITGGAGGNATAGTGNGGNGTSIVLNPGAGGTSAGGNAGVQGFVRASKTLLMDHTTAAINSTATATAAQVATGYITSTSAAGTTITLPTGTLLGAALGATQGTIHRLYVDNTAGANTVTIAVAVNGILSALAVANAGSAGLLTIPSGVTGQAEFVLMFSSSTAYSFSRVG